MAADPKPSPNGNPKVLYAAIGMIVVGGLWTAYTALGVQLGLRDESPEEKKTRSIQEAIVREQEAEKKKHEKREQQLREYKEKKAAGG